MPFNFDKPINFSSVSKTDSVVIIPALVQLLNSGFSLFSILIYRFFVELEIAMITTRFLRVIGKRIDFFEDCPLGS
jgi:hypothetical protein